MICSNDTCVLLQETNGKVQTPLGVIWIMWITQGHVASESASKEPCLRNKVQVQVHVNFDMQYAAISLSCACGLCRSTFESGMVCGITSGEGWLLFGEQWHYRVKLVGNKHCMYRCIVFSGKSAVWLSSDLFRRVLQENFQLFALKDQLCAAFSKTSHQSQINKPNSRLFCDSFWHENKCISICVTD